MNHHNRSLSLIGGGTLGVIGALMLPAYTLVGILVIIVAAILVAMTFHNKKTKPQHELTHQMKIETTDQKHQQMMKFVSGPEVTPELQTLLKALHKANRASRQPVFVGDYDETLMSVQDVLAEMIVQADARGIPLHDLEKHSTLIHERIFVNVEAACKAEPKELEAACIWLADRTLKDLNLTADTKPVGRFESMFNDMIDK